MMSRFFLITICIFWATMADCQISGIERKIVEKVDRNHDEALAFLKKIVNINSGTMNFAGIKKVSMNLLSGTGNWVLMYNGFRETALDVQDIWLLQDWLPKVRKFL